MKITKFSIVFACCVAFVTSDLTPSNNVIHRTAASGGCKEMLETFAAFSANFTYCAIRNARPIKLCTECVSYYITLGIVYNEILQYPDSDGQCRDELFNLDRLQVVVSGYQYVTGLWQRASCDSCFKSSPTGSPSTELTKIVTDIFNASASLNICISNHRNESIKPDTETCEQCAQNYTKLNNLYSNLKADSGEIAFCMDVVDLINTTRYIWSLDIGCHSDRKNPETVFLLTSTIVSILPALFYFLVYIFTTKKIYNVLPQNRWTHQDSQHDFD